MEHDELVRIVDDYSDMILRIAYQNLKNQADAEDIAQEVMIKLMKQDRFSDEEYLKAWLIRVTINLCKDYRRLAWFRKRVKLEVEWQPFTQEVKNVFNELWKLPVKDRNILYLYYYEGYSIKEIANILHLKENTVSSQLTRARKKLKLILETEM